MSTSSPQSCSAKGKISKTILQAKLLHWDQNGEANRSGPASNMHTSSKLRNTHTFGRWETQEISWHLIQALSAHAPIMSLVPAQTIASTRLVLTPLNTSANILFPEQKYNHISHLVVLKGLNHTQQTTQAWVHNGRNYWGGGKWEENNSWIGNRDKHSRNFNWHGRDWFALRDLYGQCSERVLTFFDKAF